MHAGAQTTAETAALAAHAAEAGADAVAVIGPPYYALDEHALLAHFAGGRARLRSAPLLPLRVQARAGYSIPLPVIERLRETAPNLRGLKVSNQPFDAVEPYLLEGLDVFVGAESAGRSRASSMVRPERCPGWRRHSRSSWRGWCTSGEGDVGPVRAALERFPFHAALKRVLARRGVPDPRGRARTAAHAHRRGARGARPMARIVVAGAGAAGASVAYHLALLGARDVVVCDPRGVAGGSTSRAMGGVRQQFSTAAEVRLAQASIRFFAELGEPLFTQVGYLFLATTEAGLAALEERRELQASLGVPVERVDPGEVPGLAVGDVLGAVTCREDGIADPPGVCREVVRRAVELGVDVREGEDAVELDRDVLVIACGPWSGEVGEQVGVELPIRPLCRQLVDTEPVDGLPADLPMVIERDGLPLPEGPVRRAAARDGRGDPALGLRDRGRRGRSSMTGSRGSADGTRRQRGSRSRGHGAVSTT